MESILTSVKKMIGIAEEYEHFDNDIIININAVFADLAQMGVGPANGFAIFDDETTRLICIYELSFCSILLPLAPIRLLLMSVRLPSGNGD